MRRYCVLACSGVSSVGFPEVAEGIVVGDEETNVGITGVVGVAGLLELTSAAIIVLAAIMRVPIRGRTNFHFILRGGLAVGGVDT